MTRSEAEALVKEAVALAISRDGSSGGVVRLVTVHSGGAEKSLALPQVPARPAPPPPPPPYSPSPPRAVRVGNVSSPSTLPLQCPYRTDAGFTAMHARRKVAMQHG